MMILYTYKLLEIEDVTMMILYTYKLLEIEDVTMMIYKVCDMQINKDESNNFLTIRKTQKLLNFFSNKRPFNIIFVNIKVLK